MLKIGDKVYLDGCIFSNECNKKIAVVVDIRPDWYEELAFIVQVKVNNEVVRQIFGLRDIGTQVFPYKPKILDIE